MCLADCVCSFACVCGTHQRVARGMTTPEGAEQNMHPSPYKQLPYWMITQWLAVRKEAKISADISSATASNGNYRYPTHVQRPSNRSGPALHPP